MTFPEWRTLPPVTAAREIHTRVRTRLSPAQRRAVIATLASEESLSAQFAAAPLAAPLVRVPCFVKDLFDIAGAPTCAGSTFLHELRALPTRDSKLVGTLRAAGAAFAGKTHLHEFAYGITGENPHYGDCEHPRFPGRTTGGSSSGSAAIVAAGIAPLAIASDTGGSVRVPAAFCGLFGFRLTPRDRWINDAFPLAPSFDTAGWFTADAADMRETIGALIGLRASQREPRGCYLELPALDADVSAACANTALRIAPPAEADVARDLLRGFAGALDAYNVIVALEAWEVHKSWAERMQPRYDPAVWQRLNRVHALTPMQIDAAQFTLTTQRMLWTQFFATYDFLILPATPCPALTKAQCTPENRTRLLALTTPVSLAGLPVVSIPVRLPSGMSTGLQVVVNNPQSPVVNWVLEKFTH